MSFRTAYEDNHVSFEITDIEWEDDFEEPSEFTETESEFNEELRERYEGANYYGFERSSIQFEYQAPAISVDTSGRFAKHEIIGGSTVRQKIGEDPIEVSINGICREPTARLLDALRDAKYGTIYSNRLSDGSLTVQFASVSTSPIDDSGGVAISDDEAEFLYQYTISAVEVTT